MSQDKNHISNVNLTTCPEDKLEEYWKWCKKEVEKQNVMYYKLTKEQLITRLTSTRWMYHSATKRLIKNIRKGQAMKEEAKEASEYLDMSGRGLQHDLDVVVERLEEVTEKIKDKISKEDFEELENIKENICGFESVTENINAADESIDNIINM